MSHCKSTVRDLHFNIFDCLDLDKVLASGEFSDLNGDSVREMITEAARLAECPLAASFADADRNPPMAHSDRHWQVVPPGHVATRFQLAYLPPAVFAERLVPTESFNPDRVR